MKKQFIIFFLLISNSFHSQESKYLSSLPVFEGCNIHTLDNERKHNIINKTLDFISEKTNETFLKRMNLKENDSIEFPVEYWVSKEGNVIKDSTKIDTPIQSFNNYISLVINTLPKFIPAQNVNLENIDYKISFVSRFRVKNSKLLHYQYDIEELDFHKNSDLLFIPIFKGCENFNDKMNCFNEQMNIYIKKNLNYPKSAAKKNIQGKVSVQFIIDEKGDVIEIKTIGPEFLVDEAYRIIKLLPKFEPGYKNGIPVRVKYGLPLTFRLNN